MEFKKFAKLKSHHKKGKGDKGYKTKSKSSLTTYKITCKKEKAKGYGTLQIYSTEEEGTQNINHQTIPTC